MYPLRLPFLLLLLLVLLQCVASAPNNRYFSPSASSEQDSALLEREGWLLPELVSNPSFNIRGARTQRGLTSVNSHHIQKRKCQTATCVTQRLADFLVRSSNTIGTVYAPTNVGSSTYGKRDLLQSLNYMPL